MSFSQAELDYLRSQPLGRLATSRATASPTPYRSASSTTGPTCTSAASTRSGPGSTATSRTGTPRSRFVIDDLASVQPWIPRYLRVYGEADLVEREGRFGPAHYLRITPTVSWSFNLEGRPFTHDEKVTTTRTVHTSEAARADELRHPPVRAAPGNLAVA